ncbi:MAG: PKD-like domain-containing protein, partial [Crocinitomicaceae bacterium]
MRSSILKFLFVALTVLAGKGIVLGQLTAEFITRPAYTTSGSTYTLNVCSGSQVLFVLSDLNTTSITSTTTVNWSFTGGASISSSQMRTPFAVTFTSSGSATLTLQDGSNIQTKTLQINVTSSPPITPTISSGTGGGLSLPSPINVNGIPKFYYCPNPETGSHSIVLNLSQSLVCSPNSGFTINDNSTNSVQLQVLGASSFTNPTTCPVQTFSKSFSQGFYYLILRINFSNGCTYSKVYFLEIGKPSISTTSAATSACDPGLYSFQFTDQSPSVNYTVFWDANNVSGSTTSYSSQYPNPTLPIDPQSVSNQYTFVNCSGTPASQPTKQIKLRAVGECGTTETTVANINISKGPDARIRQTPPKICAGNTVQFIDSSYSGVYVDGSGLCSNTYNRFWLVNPAITSPNTLTGSLGDIPTNQSGNSQIGIYFSTPGIYNISLIVSNNACQKDTLIRTIEVVPAPIVPAQNRTICTGSTFNATPINNSPTTVVPTGTTYSWTVTDNPNVTGDVSGTGSAITGTLSLNSGVNTQQSVTYNVTASSGTNPTCSTTFQLVVTVYPQINITDYSVTLCSGDQFSITPTNGNPSGTMVPPGTTYSWPVPSVTGGMTGGASGTNATSVTGTLVNPTFATQTATYTVTASAGASCPTDQFMVNVTSNNVSTGTIGSNQTKCSGDNPDAFSFSTLPTGSGTINYQWQSSTTSTGPWFDISGATTSSYDPGTTITSTTYYRVRITSTLNGVACSNLTNVVSITVNPLPTVAAIADYQICEADPSGVNDG